MILSLNLMLNFLNKKLMNINILNMTLLFILMILKNNNFMNNYWNKINYNLGMDYISLNLILLTLWIMYMSILSNNKLLKNKFKMKFLNIMLILTNTLLLCFCCMNFMMFYIMFETSLIPIMMIIMGWGYQIDRIQASMYMLFYTLIGSLPLMMLIIYLYMNINSLMFFTMTMFNYKLNNMNNMMMYTMLNLAFLIKMPMYMTHLWLPKAHVEAPISGSMILAGIMLKLGSYGIYRSMIIFLKMSINMNYIIIMFSLMGSLLASLICLNQNDLKIIVAYSSIVHMNMMMASMMTVTFMGMISSVMMMMAHGFCSPGMFFLVNLNYERLKSRMLMINKNLINFIPSLTLWWFLIYSSNFSAPPSLNLFSEILLINSLIQWNKMTIIFIMLISFFSTCYSILMYAMTQYGKNDYTFSTFNMINCREFMIIFMLWMPLNLIFLNMNLLY